MNTPLGQNIESPTRLSVEERRAHAKYVKQGVAIILEHTKMDDRYGYIQGWKNGSGNMRNAIFDDLGDEGIEELESIISDINNDIELVSEGASTEKNVVNIQKSGSIPVSDTIQYQEVETTARAHDRIEDQIQIQSLTNMEDGSVELSASIRNHIYSKFQDFEKNSERRVDAIQTFQNEIYAYVKAENDVALENIAEALQITPKSLKSTFEKALQRAEANKNTESNKEKIVSLRADITGTIATDLTENTKSLEKDEMELKEKQEKWNEARKDGTFEEKILNNAPGILAVLDSSNFGNKARMFLVIGSLESQLREIIGDEAAESKTSIVENEEEIKEDLTFNTSKRTKSGKNIDFQVNPNGNNTVKKLRYEGYIFTHNDEEQGTHIRREGDANGWDSRDRGLVFRTPSENKLISLIEEYKKEIGKDVTDLKLDNQDSTSKQGAEELFSTSTFMQAKLVTKELEGKVEEAVTNSEINTVEVAPVEKSKLAKGGDFLKATILTALGVKTNLSIINNK